MRLLDAMGEGTPLVVEDADRVAYDEKALFHLLNLAREKGLYRAASRRESAPSRWGVALPDLTSRLNAVPAVEIGAPDEALHPDGAAEAFRRPPARYRSESA